jgi:hypothetical protein
MIQSVVFKGTQEERQMARWVFNLMMRRGLCYALNSPIELTLNMLADYFFCQCGIGDSLEQITELIDTALAKNGRVFHRHKSGNTIAYVTTKRGYYLAPAPSTVYSRQLPTSKKTLDAQQELAVQVTHLPDDQPLDIKTQVEQISEQLQRVHVPLDTDQIMGMLPTLVRQDDITVAQIERALQENRRIKKVKRGPKPRWISKEAIWPPPPGKPKRFRIPPVRSEIRIGTRQLPRDLQQMLDTIEDELQGPVEAYRRVSQVEFAITASHPFHGTLPLTRRTRGIFPPGDADAPVTFIDARSGERIPGGVSPQDRYAWGLAEWYENYQIPAGGKIRLERTEVEGEIKIDYVPAGKGVETCWLRKVSYDQSTDKLTAVTTKRTYWCEVDKDLLMHGLIFEDPQAMQKEATKSIFDLMCQVFPVLAEQGKSVHCKTLFNCVNLVRRCSPYTVFAELSSRPCFSPDPDQAGHWLFDANTADRIGPAIKTIERLDERLAPLRQWIDALQTRAEEQARRLEFLKV